MKQTSLENLSLGFLKYTSSKVWSPNKGVFITKEKLFDHVRQATFYRWNQLGVCLYKI